MAKPRKEKQVKLKKLKTLKTNNTKTYKAMMDVSNLTLPTELSEPELELGGYSLMIFGRKKIGKTSLISKFPECFCMFFEPGGKALRLHQRRVTHWEEFLQYIKLLETTKHIFKTVLIDTGFFCYECCFDFVCNREGFDYPPENDYGKGWGKIKKELHTALVRLMNLNVGLVVNCHEKTEKIKGTNIIRTIPDLSGQANSFFAGVIDTIGYYHYTDEGERILQIQGTEFLEAGTRCEENFLTVNGDRVYNIPMGKSSKEAYENLIDAFNNKQAETGKEVLRKVKLKKKQ